MATPNLTFTGAVVVRTDRSDGTGKRAGLIDYEISVRQESEAMGGGGLLAGPFRVPDYKAVRFRNRLINRLCHSCESVRTYGRIER